MITSFIGYSYRMKPRVSREPTIKGRRRKRGIEKEISACYASARWMFGISVGNGILIIIHLTVTWIGMVDIGIIRQLQIKRNKMKKKRGPSTNIQIEQVQFYLLSRFVFHSSKSLLLNIQVDRLFYTFVYLCTPYSTNLMVYFIAMYQTLNVYFGSFHFISVLPYILYMCKMFCRTRSMLDFDSRSTFNSDVYNMYILFDFMVFLVCLILWLFILNGYCVKRYATFPSSFNIPTTTSNGSWEWRARKGWVDWPAKNRRRHCRNTIDRISIQ